MMPVALKAQWSVQAGLIPGEPMEKCTCTWVYTSKHYEEDGGRRGQIFRDAQKEASNYAIQLESSMNWVRLEYLWL